MLTIDVRELKEKIDSGDEITLIDVRESWEHEEFNLGGELIPLGDLPAKLQESDLPDDRDIVVYCRTGNRSSMAQYFLIENDYPRVFNLKGGVEAWKEEIGE